MIKTFSPLANLMEYAPTEKTAVPQDLSLSYLSASMNFTASRDDLRKVSTLAADPQYMLNRAEMRSGFMFFFNNLVRGGLPPEAFYASLVCSILYPNLQQNLPTRKDIRRSVLFKTFWKNWSERSLHSMCSVRKNMSDETVTVSFPVMTLSRSALDLGNLALLFNDVLPVDPQTGQAPVAQLPSAPVELGALTATPSIKPAYLKAFQEAKAVLTVSALGTDTQVFMVTLTMPRNFAEFLVNSDWLQIRSLDLYGPIYEWVRGYFGRFGKSPSYCIPLAKIAESVGEGNPPRVSEDGMIVDEKGRFLYLPKISNQISKYEEAAMAAYSGEDGSISLMNAKLHQRTPPSSMPVFVDWTNLKFAYTSLEGRLLIKNLDRTLPANRTHFVHFLERKITDEDVVTFFSLVSTMADFLKVGYVPGVNIIQQEILKSGRIRDEYISLTDIGLYELLNYVKPGKRASDGTDDPANQTLIGFVEAAQKVLTFIQNSPDNAYARYSVLTILDFQACLTVFLKYGPDFYKVRMEDETSRAAYLNQGAQADYESPALPFIADGVGKLPHQTKVENILREGPDNAMLPVDTGGGKSMICITDILKEMTTSKGPYLIMCPPHLVSQYVKELVYFTQGRLNALPISSYTIRRQGLSRLQVLLENRPVNSVVIADYDCLLLKRRALAYGTGKVTIYPTVEFLRQFKFEYVFLDESHYLRNASTRQAAVNRLIADIRKKRLASGTIVANTLGDLVNQAALLDPSIFGTYEEFVKEYALETRGSKVLVWKPGAEAKMKAKLREHCVIAEAKKKEWAAILPQPVERFHKVEMTAAQMEVYQMILKESLEALQAKAQENEALKKLLHLGGPAGQADSDETTDDSDSAADDEEEDIPLDQLLKPFLARMERFLTAPGKDPLGATALTGDDLVSPKARKIVELTMNHIAKGIVGKVLIFTNYTWSAEAIYEAFPEDFRSSVIYYTADRKDECGSEFENNPKKLAMVGVENSMNTGLNLQYCSRLIRVETVWTPGVLEQGNARIGRPNIKKAEDRKEIWYDWVITNNTIDVTKISYLMSKSITKAKFDEAGNTRFDELEVPPLFPMTLDALRESNDFDSTMLDYFSKYEKYKQAVFAEYAEYREKNKTSLFTPEGTIRIAPLERSENLPGSKLMLRVPYVPGTELYRAEDLGLKRYDEFLRLNSEDLESDEDTDEDTEVDDEIAENDPQREALLAERQQAVGLAVHTDRGDGEIVRVGRTTLGVMLPSGERIKVRKLAAFIITRANTSNKDIRSQLLKLTGDVPIDKPIDVLETKLTDRMAKRLQREEERQKREAEKESRGAVSMTLEFTVVNDYLGIRVTNIEDPKVVRAAQAFGFKFTPAYYAAHMRNPQAMLKLFQKWKEIGMHMDKDNSQACLNAWSSFMKQGKKAVVKLFGIAAAQDIRNFYRMEFKPNPDRTNINPYPLIQDNELYIALPKQGHPGSMVAIRKAQVPGVKWMVYDAETELVAFTPTKAKASKVIQMMLDAGITIPNLNQLIREFKKLRIARDVKE